MVLDLNAEHRCAVRLNWVDPGRGDGQSVEYADFPGQAADTQRIAAVRRQVDVDDHVVQTQGHAEIGSAFKAGVEFQDSVGVGVEAEFPCAQQHPFGDDATQFGSVDHGAIGEDGAHSGKRAQQSRDDVRRPADDGRRTRSIVHLADRQPGGVGMRFHRRDLGDDNAGKLPGDAVRAVNFQPGVGELIAQFRCGDRDRHPFLEPLLAVFHANWSRKRSSLSNSRRMSSIS